MMSDECCENTSGKVLRIEMEIENKSSEFIEIELAGLRKVLVDNWGDSEHYSIKKHIIALREFTACNPSILYVVYLYTAGSSFKLYARDGTHALMNVLVEYEPFHFTMLK